MASVVALVAVVLTLAITSPWSSGDRLDDQSQAERRVDPLAVSRELVGGKARFTECRDHGLKRVCEVEGPTGERAICSLFKSGETGEVEEYSCFERFVGEGR